MTPYRASTGIFKVEIYLIFKALTINFADFLCEFWLMDT